MFLFLSNTKTATQFGRLFFYASARKPKNCVGPQKAFRMAESHPFYGSFSSCQIKIPTYMDVLRN